MKMQIEYETLYGVVMEKLQISERENIELRAICLQYHRELEQYKLKESNKKENTEKESNREIK